MSCAKKVRQGRACTMAELKAAMLLLDDARKTALGTVRMLKDRVSFLERFVNR